VSRWDAFRADEHYTLQDLGRPAVFLVPKNKLRIPLNGVSLEEHLHRFLTINFGAYTASTFTSFGFWQDDERRIVYDEVCQYEVSFHGKDRIPILMKELAVLAKLIGENCIYFKAGQYACLIFPL